MRTFNIITDIYTVLVQALVVTFTIKIVNINSYVSC